MTRIQHLELAVTKLYQTRHPKRADWADWLWENHVIVVAENAAKLAKKYDASEELARAAALLHDIADTKMSRLDVDHESESLAMSRDLMRKAGFKEAELRLVVDDAIKLHSCYDGNSPKSLEGKILASADSMAHLLTDFYIYAAWTFGKEGKSLGDLKAYARKKIDRDFLDKIQFEDVRKECQASYGSLQALLGN